MQRIAIGLFRFLPVQLLLLHFRKYQVLLVFWLLLFATIARKFSAAFGSHSLFLAPEYMGHTGLWATGILGGALAVFTMSWHITTFIVHTKRMPYLGAARQAFLTYCVNNSVLPLLFLLYFTVLFAQHQHLNEGATAGRIVLLLLGLYLGFLLSLLISFAYFFRTDRDLLKVVISRITDPSRIREFIPYDSLDYDFDIVRANTYLCSNGRIERLDALEKYHPRVLSTVLRRHHRNAMVATLTSLLLLILLGVFLDRPALRIPAGASFLLFFSVAISLVGAVSYFFRSWQLLAWIGFTLLVGLLFRFQLFDLRTTAPGLVYKDGAGPAYNYDRLRQIFTPEQYRQDLRTETQRLDRWRSLVVADSAGKPPLVVICVSGGGSRSAYWTFRILQHLDSATGGSLYRHTALITGASGGMLGAAYWRALHRAAAEGRIRYPYDPRYQQAIGKDLLNAIIASLTTVDLVSPFAKVKVGGLSYDRDRAHAFEQELIRNTGGLLDGRLADALEPEQRGEMPLLIANGTIVNDGRRLLMAASPVGYLTRSATSLPDTILPAIDGVDFNRFFAGMHPERLRLVSALRMNATFPYILPVTKLPSQPTMNIMDAGLRDNFGMEVAMRYLTALRGWTSTNTRDVVFLQIRDSREHEVFRPTSQEEDLGSLLFDPATVITRKWEPFQSYYGGYLRDAGQALFGPRFHYLRFQYMPRIPDAPAALNFHLTSREKEDLLRATEHPINRASEDSLQTVLR